MSMLESLRLLNNRAAASISYQVPVTLKHGNRMHASCSSRPEVAQQAGAQGRRDALFQLAVSLLLQQALPVRAAERRGIGRYIKKKALDPLVTYVPAVLQAREQLIAAGKLMGEDPKEARIALRSGAFEGLRDNVRALGEYAASSKAASDQEAKQLVNETFLTLQNYDFELFQAIRTQQPVPDAASAQLQSAVAALDSLLATVPAPVFSQAQDVVRIIEEGGRAGGGSKVDTERFEKLVPNTS